MQKTSSSWPFFLIRCCQLSVSFCVISLLLFFFLRSFVCVQYIDFKCNFVSLSYLHLFAPLILLILLYVAVIIASSLSRKCFLLFLRTFVSSRHTRLTLSTIYIFTVYLLLKIISTFFSHYHKSLR